MPEARYDREDQRFSSLLAAATLDAGGVVQLPTGEAAVLDSGASVSSGARTDLLRTRGKFVIEKTTGQIYVPGQEVYWDHSANKLHYLKVSDRDFLVGTVCVDAVAADLTAVVDLNKRQCADIDLNRDCFDTVLVGTQAVGGFGEPKLRGGARKLVLSSTNEAQKVDLLSRDRFAVAANWIAEYLFTVPSVGSGTAPDFNLAVANATSATDVEAITEFVTVRVNGNAVDLFADSDDGTTDVGETDTAVNLVAGSAVANRCHVLLDGRNPADIQIIVNGALVNDATTFSLAAAAGPLGLLIHLEKTSAADTFEADVERARVWYSEQ